MDYDKNIYARIAEGNLSAEEEQRLKNTGEWDEIQRILKATANLQLDEYDVDLAYDQLIKKRDNRS